MIEWLRLAPALRGPVHDPVHGPQHKVHIGGRDVPVALRRHARAKRLTMRLAPDGSEVRITLPMWGRMQDALAFARSRSAWLEEQLARLPGAAPVAPGATLLYRGEDLLIDWQQGLPRRPCRHGPAVQLGGPPASLPRRLQAWLEGEALALLAEDLAYYCQRAGCEAPELRLSRAQRRWGSCSSRNCIRINWRLVQAPDMVRRSVVAHEVAHLAHFDHSPAFHALLGQLFEGDIAVADGWLKREGRMLYARFG